MQVKENPRFKVIENTYKESRHKEEEMKRKKEKQKKELNNESNTKVTDQINK